MLLHCRALRRCTTAAATSGGLQRQAVSLPDQFGKVVAGKELRLPGSLHSEWSTLDHASRTGEAILGFLAVRCPVARRSANPLDPMDAARGWNAFTNPPCTDRNDIRTAVCMPLKASFGVYKIGRYFYVLIGKDSRNKSVTMRAHRLVCWLVRGEPAGHGMQACHSCRTPGCVNPLHLDWGTDQQNKQQDVDRREAKRAHSVRVRPLRRRY